MVRIGAGHEAVRRLPPSERGGDRNRQPVVRWVARKVVGGKGGGGGRVAEEEVVEKRRCWWRRKGGGRRVAIKVYALHML